MMSSSITKPTAGHLRFISDKRQIAGLLLVTGSCALFQPLPDMATLITPGATATSGIPLWALIADICLVIIGMVALFIGYNELVHDWGNKYLTGFLIVFTQTAFISYLTTMTSIGMGARSGAAFIPPTFNPTPAEVKFVGAMGIIGVISYAFTFVGSIAFMQFSLFAYQAGKPQDRNAAYYAGRKLFYTAMLMLAGLSQFLLGVVIRSKFGSGVLELGTIGVAMYAVNFPAICIFIGILQILNAIWAFARSFGIGVFGEKDFSFQASMFFAWFMQILLQVIVQVSYVPGGTLAPATTTITALSLGLNLMPAYLDYKARTVPAEITAEYYGLAEENTEAVDPVKDVDVAEDADV